MKGPKDRSIEASYVELESAVVARQRHFGALTVEGLRGLAGFVCWSRPNQRRPCPSYGACRRIDSAGARADTQRLRGFLRRNLAGPPSNPGFVDP